MCLYSARNSWWVAAEISWWKMDTRDTQQTPYARAVCWDAKPARPAMIDSLCLSKTKHEWTGNLCTYVKDAMTNTLYWIIVAPLSKCSNILNYLCCSFLVYNRKRSICWLSCPHFLFKYFRWDIICQLIPVAVAPRWTYLLIARLIFQQFSSLLLTSFFGLGFHLFIQT